MNNDNKLRSTNSSTCSLPTAAENSSENICKNTFAPYDWTGILIATVIVTLWFASLLNLLSVSVVNTSYFWLIVSILERAYLHTGLFIIAHDAMHGNLIPSNKTLNNIIGRLAVGIYGLLPYDRCRMNHTNHHRLSLIHI